MTQEEFNNTNWHRGNVVKLRNGKEYLVKGLKAHGRYLLLYSYEYESSFVADYNIVDCRTSDYEEPEEVYLEMRRQKRAEAEAKREAERQAALKAKAERKQRNIEAQEKAHQEALARKAAIKREKKQAQLKSSQAELVIPDVKTDKKIVEEKVAPKAETKPVVSVEPKKTDAPKKTEVVAQPAPEAPKKRVRQRIRISSATPIREKVEFFKRK